MKCDQQFVPGKIILCGEYAVVFGYPGIAMPSSWGITVTIQEEGARAIESTGHRFDQPWLDYTSEILNQIERKSGRSVKGKIIIDNQLPLGRGLGSSTALIIALCRAVLGLNCRETALEIESHFNPYHSGLDFAVIWEGKPVYYQKGKKMVSIELPDDLLKDTFLVDTGKPFELTKDLVTRVKEREKQLKKPLEIIGGCADRLLEGEDLLTLFKEHHRAQKKLGVVPPYVDEFIKEIEQAGGAAKVVGAGGRDGGGGMLLAVNSPEEVFIGCDYWLI